MSGVLDVIPTKPTKAMRSHLDTLARNGGSASPMTLGYPAYPIMLKMEHAGWIKPVWAARTIEIWKRPSVIWSRPKCWRITRAGRGFVAKPSPNQPHSVTESGAA